VYVVQPSIESSGHAANGPTLAGCIHPFEHEHRRKAPETPALSEQRQATLLLLELLLVVLLVESEREIQRAHDRQPLDARCGDGWLCRLSVALAEAALKRRQQRLSGVPVSVATIDAFEHQPRCVRRVGLAQQSCARRAVIVIALELFPILLVHPVARLLVRPELLEPALLGLLGEVKPEFDNARPFVREHLFKAPTLGERRHEFSLPAFSERASLDRVRIPGAREDPDLSSRRQAPPEAPHGRAFPFLVARRTDSVHLDEARIHPLRQDLDRFTLAGARNATEHDDDGESGEAQDLHLCVQQLFAQPWEFLPVCGLVERVAEFCRFEHTGDYVRSNLGKQRDCRPCPVANRRASVLHGDSRSAASQCS
jgi:hypothetical protein